VNDARPSAPAVAEGGDTILLVEDDAQVRQIVTRMLESFGYRVLATASGEEGLALVSDSAARIDLLLTDLVMPGFGGREVAERLRKHRPDVRVLYMSGYTADVGRAPRRDRSRDRVPPEAVRRGRARRSGSVAPRRGARGARGPGGRR
jgi:CheY-like chemotaxis protein